MISEMRYFESLNKRLEKGVSYKKKELNEVKSIRDRYSQDIKRVSYALDRNKKFSCFGFRKLREIKS